VRDCHENDAPGLRLVLWLAGLLTSAPAEVPRPNIIFILADDLGYGDLGSYGQKLIRTPHLDRMAAEGMRFTQFYAGSTVFAPSRSVLMTGQHLGRTRVRDNAGALGAAAQSLQADDVTVARVLKQAGYATGLVGKWGLGEAGTAGAPERQGFDYFLDFSTRPTRTTTTRISTGETARRPRCPTSSPRSGPCRGPATRRSGWFTPAIFFRRSAGFRRAPPEAAVLSLSLVGCAARQQRAFARVGRRPRSAFLR